MLNHQTNKDIIFNLQEWAEPSGNTGAYLMYQYARISSINRNIIYPNQIQHNYNLLNSIEEKLILYQLSQYQKTIYETLFNFDNKPNPSILCNYLYNLAHQFSIWYSNKNQNSIKNCNNLILKATRLLFANAVSLTLKNGLQLLGIQILEKM